MAWFDSPDCLSPVEPRTREEIVAAARALPPGGLLVVSDDEFKTIAREVSLAWRFAGRRVLVVGR